jgi:hypothetical protein
MFFGIEAFPYLAFDVQIRVYCLVSASGRCLGIVEGIGAAACGSCRFTSSPNVLMVVTVSHGFLSPKKKN